MISNSKFDGPQGQHHQISETQRIEPERGYESLSLKFATAVLATASFFPGESAAQDVDVPAKHTSTSARSLFAESSLVHLECIDRSGNSYHMSTCVGLLVRVDKTGFFLLDSTDQKEKFIAHQNVLHASFEDVSPVTATPVPDALSVSTEANCTEVLLADGSRLRADSVVTKGSSFILQHGQEFSEIPCRVLRSIRYATDSAYDARWSTLTAADQGESATLVVRNGALLDSLPVEVQSITPDTITIEFNGNIIPIAQAGKIEGILFRAPGDVGGAEKAPPICSVTGSFGRIEASTIQYCDDGVMVCSQSGLRLSLKFKEIESLDFSPGKTMALSAVEKQVVRWDPLASAPDDSVAFDLLLRGSLEPVSSKQSSENGIQKETLCLSEGVEAEFLVRGRADHLIGELAVADCSRPGSSTVVFSNGENVLLEQVLEIPTLSPVPEDGHLRLTAPILPGISESEYLQSPIAREERSATRSVPISVDLSGVRSLIIRVEGNLPVQISGARLFPVE